MLAALAPVLRSLLALTPAQRSALGALYAATDGEGWANKTGWLGASDPCEWFGVTCNDGAVVELNMRTGADEYGFNIGNSMAGTLPSQLSGAAGLAVLWLYDNNISGTMPTELMKLTGLEALVLSNSPPIDETPGYYSAAPLPMSGTVPTQLAALEGLGFLALQYSSLSGTLPVELANLTALSAVYCNNNAVSGTLPPHLAELTTLTILDLDTTSLSGTVPTQLAELSTLTFLDLDATSLSTRVRGRRGRRRRVRRRLLWRATAGL